MNTYTSHPYEGLLLKYTNAMKGWQHRWFILRPESGELYYFLNESEKSQKPRCSIYLAGAVITSDEDSNAFSVQSATGHLIKLKAPNAQSRKEWVDKIKAVVNMLTRSALNNYSSNPFNEIVTIDNNNATFGVIDAFANCHEHINKAEQLNIALSQAIESSSKYLDRDLLALKATAHATLHTLNQCLNILYQ